MSDMWVGTITYVRDDTGACGHEHFDVTRTPDGSWSVRARTQTDDTLVFRDVLHILDPNYRPVSSHVAQWKDGQRRGDGWFIALDESVECTSWLAGQGVISQRVAIGRRPAFIVPHAVVCDAYICATYDTSTGGRQHIVGGVRSSPRADGTTGPLASAMSDLHLTHEATEQVRVPAGVFTAHRFLIESDGNAREHLWVTDDPVVLVRLRSDRLGTTYELTKFRKA